MAILVLMQHSAEFTEYDDQIGEQYHYPSQYFDRIVEGRSQALSHLWSCRLVCLIQRLDLFRFASRCLESIEKAKFCLIQVAAVNYLLKGLIIYHAYRALHHGNLRSTRFEIGAVLISIQHLVRELKVVFYLAIPVAFFCDVLSDRTYGSRAEVQRLALSLFGFSMPFLGATIDKAGRVERGAAIGGKVKMLNGHKCQVCHSPPFMTRTGRPYAEAHHLTPLHRLEPGSLTSQNVICVCANCHRKMHYGNVELIAADARNMTFEIDGARINVSRNVL